MNETKTKIRHVIKVGASLLITLPIDFCRKTEIKAGDVLGVTYNSSVLIVTPMTIEKKYQHRYYIKHREKLLPKHRTSAIESLRRREVK